MSHGGDNAIKFLPVVVVGLLREAHAELGDGKLEQNSQLLGNLGQPPLALAAAGGVPVVQIALALDRIGGAQHVELQRARPDLPADGPQDGAYALEGYDSSHTHPLLAFAGGKQSSLSTALVATHILAPKLRPEPLLWICHVRVDGNSAEISNQAGKGRPQERFGRRCLDLRVFEAEKKVKTRDVELCKDMRRVPSSDVGSGLEDPPRVILKDRALHHGRRHRLLGIDKAIVIFVALKQLGELVLIRCGLLQLVLDPQHFLHLGTGRAPIERQLAVIQIHAQRDQIGNQALHFRLQALLQHRLAFRDGGVQAAARRRHRSSFVGVFRGAAGREVAQDIGKAAEILSRQRNGIGGCAEGDVQRHAGKILVRVRLLWISKPIPQGVDIEVWQSHVLPPLHRVICGFPFAAEEQQFADFDGFVLSPKLLQGSSLPPHRPSFLLAQGHGAGCCCLIAKPQGLDTNPKPRQVIHKLHVDMVHLHDQLRQRISLSLGAPDPVAPFGCAIGRPCCFADDPHIPNDNENVTLVDCPGSTISETEFDGAY
eukprot:scaffold407_cov251-Pinguiococcus_pyrenoidosus.AAC.18